MFGFRIELNVDSISIFIASPTRTEAAAVNKCIYSVQVQEYRLIVVS